MQKFKGVSWNKKFEFSGNDCCLQAMVMAA